MMPRFALLAGSEQLPDVATIRNFLCVLESHGLAEQLFSQVNAHLAAEGLGLRRRMVHAPLIAAPRSTKNRIR